MKKAGKRGLSNRGKSREDVVRQNCHCVKTVRMHGCLNIWFLCEGQNPETHLSASLKVDSHLTSRHRHDPTTTPHKNVTFKLN